MVAKDGGEFDVGLNSRLAKRKCTGYEDNTTEKRNKVRHVPIEPIASLGVNSLFSGDVEVDAAGVRVGAVFPEVDALPGA